MELYHIGGAVCNIGCAGKSCSCALTIFAGMGLALNCTCSRNCASDGRVAEVLLISSCMYSKRALVASVADKQ